MANFLPSFFGTNSVFRRGRKGRDALSDISNEAAKKLVDEIDNSIINAASTSFPSNPVAGQLYVHHRPDTMEPEIRVYTDDGWRAVSTDRGEILPEGVTQEKIREELEKARSEKIDKIAEEFFGEIKKSLIKTEDDSRTKQILEDRNKKSEHFDGDMQYISISDSAEFNGFSGVSAVSMAMPTEEWTHVAWVRRNGSDEVFLNGQSAPIISDGAGNTLRVDSNGSLLIDRNKTVVKENEIDLNDLKNKPKAEEFALAERS